MSNEPAPFAIGTSTSVAATSNVDMSLDDIIANRRTNNQRKNPPRSTKANAAARATGQNKARRGAAIAARRGIANNAKGKPTPMEEERQVNRAQRRNAPNNNSRRGGARGTAPRISDVKAKAKARLSRARNVIAQQKQQKGGGVVAPTPQAVTAAARAMKDFGFKPPKGMQMQISFVPKKQQPEGNNNKGGRGGGNRNAGGGGRGNNGGGRGRGGRR